MEENYKNIINMILRYFSINSIKVLNEKSHKEELYILLLTLNNYGVFCDKKFMNNDEITSLKNIKKNLVKAEEKLLINREFRRKYFEFKSRIEDIM